MVPDQLHIAVDVANVLALLGVVGMGWRVARYMARMELKMDLVWSDFKKRFDIEGNGGS